MSYRRNNQRSSQSSSQGNGRKEGLGAMAIIMLAAGACTLLLCCYDGKNYMNASPEERLAKEEFWSRAFDTEEGEAIYRRQQEERDRRGRAQYGSQNEYQEEYQEPAYIDYRPVREGYDQYQQRQRPQYQEQRYQGQGQDLDYDME